jgi:ATP-dependent DNA helicase RecG
MNPPTNIGISAASGKSASLEFKKSTAEKDRACRTLSTFANGEGGRVLFGVTPAGKIVGQTVTERTLEELAQEFQGFEPPLFPTVERVPVGGGREVLVLTVARGARVPVAFRGVAYERVLNTTRSMPRATFQRLLLEEMHATERWENRPAAGWDVSRLDRRELVLTLEESIRRGRVDDPGTREPLEILRGLGLLVDGDRVSRAAVALFCAGDVPLPDFPQLLLKVARFRGTTRDEFLDNRQFHGNAFALMRRAERFLIESLPVAGRIVPGRMEREDTPLLPVEALREALANAFVHRDYSIGGGSVSVALYDDRLEIISIGELHFGLTPEALLREHESKPWNPMIARTFYRRGIIETWGRGTLKIARLMRERRLEPPAVAVREGAVVVTFALPVPVPVQTPEKAGTREKAREKTPEKTDAAVLRMLLEHSELSIAELAESLGKAPSTIERAIRKLRESGRLQRIGPDKGGHWQVIE